ncbi:MAG: hypothetical protein EPO08_07830 [Rhodospirillaceae bacterium]|nr:MAG: hypothetical protein EPO08_07830 [Rhodospirillaceae bacterium]
MRMKVFFAAASVGLALAACAQQNPSVFDGLSPLQRPLTNTDIIGGAPIGSGLFTSVKIIPVTDASVTSSINTSDSGFNATLLSPIRAAFISSNLAYSDAANFSLTTLSVLSAPSWQYYLLPKRDGAVFVLSALQVGCYEYESAQAAGIVAAGGTGSLQAQSQVQLGTAISKLQSTSKPQSAGDTSSVAAGPCPPPAVVGTLSTGSNSVDAVPTPSSAANSTPQVFAGVGAKGERVQVNLGRNLIVAVEIVEERQTSKEEVKVTDHLSHDSSGNFDFRLRTMIDTGDRTYNGPTGYACITLEIGSNLGGGNTAMNVCPKPENVQGITPVGYKPADGPTSNAFIYRTAGVGGKRGTLCSISYDPDTLTAKFATPTDASYKDAGGHLDFESAVTPLIVTEQCFDLFSTK